MLVVKVKEKIKKGVPAWLSIKQSKPTTATS